MFPICDEQGRVIGFSGRVLSGDEKTAKYVNSPETPIFTKSRVFFGLDKSKRAILDAGFAVVCEGQLDLIACFMGGVQNIVAPQGTAFTEQHARIIKRYVDEVVLCFDSDEAGQNAAVRSLDHLLASGLAVRVAVVPAPHDPDSFIKANGGEAFRQLVENAEGFFDFYLNRLCMENNLKDDKGRLSVVRSMLEVLQKTDSLVIIDRYALKIALKLNLPHASIKNEFLKLKPASNLRTENVSEEIEKVIPPTIQEKWLVKLLLQDEIKFEWVKSHLDLNWIQSSFIRKIITSWIDFRNKNVGVFHLGLWLNDLGESARNFITEMLADSRKIPSPEGQLNTLVTTFRNKFLDQQLRSLNEQEHDENLSHSQKVELLREQQKLREQKRAPLT
jgi:DNA primase